MKQPKNLDVDTEYRPYMVMVLMGNSKGLLYYFCSYRVLFNMYILVLYTVNIHEDDKTNSRD